MHALTSPKPKGARRGKEKVGSHKEHCRTPELGLHRCSLTIIMRCRSAISGTRPLQSRMTVPVGSRPLRPARPAICTYSPGSRSRKVEPSCLRMESNTTVRAGMFTPMAKVSVANKTWDRERRVSNEASRLRFSQAHLTLQQRQSSPWLLSGSFYHFTY